MLFVKLIEREFVKLEYVVLKIDIVFHRIDFRYCLL